MININRNSSKRYWVIKVFYYEPNSKFESLSKPLTHDTEANQSGEFKLSSKT